MTTLIVIPTYYRPGAYYAFPTGLMLIAAVLEENGYDPQILDLNQRCSKDKLMSTLASADVMLTGGICTYFNFITGLITCAKIACRHCNQRFDL